MYYIKDVKEKAKSEESKLLPCPFCGGTAHFYLEDNGVSNYTGSYYYIGVKCEKCNTKSDSVSTDLDSCVEDAINMWNTRV